MAHKYKVLLPKTKFPLRTSPGTSDRSIRALAQFDHLYQWQLQNRDPGKTFVLHDGPPYANGTPHMGHVLNKTLKDIVNRYKLLRGYRIQYQPGWDCHGLPIELKACRNSDFVRTPAVEIRSKAAHFAKSALNQQREAFQRWGCLGDWDRPYLTMDKEYEANQIGVFYEMFKKGCIYRGFKPVYWSPSSRTALAEAELEYKEHTSRSIYASFPLITEGSLDVGGSGRKVHALVWTTTPWSLVANRAVCYHPDHSYSLVEVESSTSGKVLLLGSNSLERLSFVLGHHRVIGSVLGSKLEGVRYVSPIDRNEELRPFLPSFHVVDHEGTGLVHTAPAHGRDDYSVGVRHGLDLSCVVDGEGRYSGEAGAELEGLHVTTEGNRAILSQLRSAGVSVHEHSCTHRYPYDWRTKKPVIIRATEQWFADVSSLKDQAKKAVVNDVIMVPPVSQRRLLPMLDSRDDWCISRQRFWGVPLPIFYHNATGKPLITDETISHIKALISEHGTDCWWRLPLKDLLPKSLEHLTQDYAKGEDTMDVWFDSGSSWASVLKGAGGVADMYLEGSDQHRGWFQSSLLTSVAVQGKPPYRSLVTHGFVLDSAGDKMSKSLGNVISPDDILSKKKFSADVMRMWVASSDYSRDVTLNDLVLKQNSDFLQKIRNVCRFLLGNLHLSDFNPREDGVKYEDLSNLDRYLLHILSDYNRKVVSAYDTLNFSGVCRALVTLIPHDLSSFYFDIIKDRLYCEAEDGNKRRSTLTVLSLILETFLRSVAPIAPHLAEEVGLHNPAQGQRGDARNVSVCLVSLV